MSRPPLPDATVNHLRGVADWPDTRGTKYQVTEVLGSGGMGSIYGAFDTMLEREVALKVLHGLVHDADGTARLQQEARILAHLEHPGIVPVHEIGTLADGRIYYVMQRVRGERLDALVARDLPRGERLRIFGRICEAVAFAHAHGVLHRDLKPENVMVGAFGAVLVMDWGVAKRLDASTAPAGVAPLQVTLDGAVASQTLPGTVLGTPAYMAPEQRQGRVDELDARTDVYALGALLHFLLAGRPPEGDPARSLAAAGIPRPLIAICCKALAPLPVDRYESASTLGDDVGRFLALLPVGAWREGPLAWMARIARRHRFALALLATYLVVRAVLFFFVGN